MADTQQEFYTGLASLLKYHEEIGLGPVVINDDIREFLATRPLLPQELRPAVEPAFTGKKIKSGVTAPQKDVAVQPGKEGETLSEVEKEVVGCTLCELHMKRKYPVPGRGESPVSLMIVGDWLALPAGVVIEDLLFGREQDQMLFRMLQAMHVPTEKVFVTNVIKCAIPSEKPPQAKHVQSCVNYLKRQIQLLRPEYICTMGMVAARALLERSLPLSRLRGRLHDYPLDENESAKVLVTYHPSYLLQNPEMKKATWQDLQFLAKKLGTM